MSQFIPTLEQLRLLRQRSVQDLQLQLASQRQRCQRYESNISTLTSLAAGVQDSSEYNPVLMSNHSGYKRNIQRVIDWQKQEQALAKTEAKKLQGALLAEAKREKSLELVLDGHKRAQALDRQRSEQKNTDAISAQCWLRQRLAEQ
ncbi:MULTISPECIES: flagellar export protein FliJ [unclassified Serratia (in: enterobacteria)]|uniref:flagellar export protein FliJ n=1 Tax=unclassified Serratia (in: enterobacteria) TaxID=2647522 RepID=UPI0005070169|nr:MULTISPECIES: flagellar export protein FliJ [unclassified Serratia (in: enterobacteria)]KFK95356.1 flagellar export protein FliJ [Serratia sp. Ag2]KFK98704.1 flagellar export protein FliJ [Serratia sp. Ag1]